MRSLSFAFISVIFTISFSSLHLWFPQPAYASGLYIEPITFDHIGLDSNNVNVGPNDYLIGARVCNISGSTLTNIQVKFDSLSTNNFITVTAVGSPRTDTITIASLPSGGLPQNPNNNNFVNSGTANITPANCYNAYYNAFISRNPSAYNTVLQYKISAAGVDTNSRVAQLFSGSTGQQQLYIEKILSQARNSVQSFVGPITVYTGGIYEYTLTTKTATAYPQLTVSSDFPNAIFEFLDVKTNYSSDPTVNTASIYNDACGWIRPPDVTGYRASSSVCAGPIPNQDNADGRVGNTVTTRYRIKILASPKSLNLANSTINVNHLILDFSGGSYHYNADYGSGLAVTPITVLDAPDLSITKTDAAPYTVGVNGNYTLTVSNVGLGNTTGVITVRDTLPSGVTLQSFNASGWTCQNSTGTACAAGNTGTLTFTNSGPLLSGASSTITLTIQPTLAALVTGTTSGNITNTATVSTIQDNNAANNTSSVTSVVNAPDLRITKTGDVSITQGQAGVSYTLAVQNIGSGATTGTITVTDTLPNGITPTAPTGSVNGWSCNISGQTVTCTRSDTFAAGSIATPTNLPNITISANVAANATVGSVTNTATVTLATDPILSNNRADLPISIIPIPPNLAITKAHTGNFLRPSTGNTYTLTITNLGGSTSGAVTVIDTVPTGLTPTNPSGTSATWTTNGWSCSISGQIVTCTRNDVLASGFSGTIDIKVNVLASAPDSFINYASVTVQDDSDTSNNSTEDPTQIAPSLSVTKVALANEFDKGGTDFYRITVTNTGGATGSTLSDKITLNDTLLDGLTFNAFVSSSDAGWRCVGTAGSTTFTCTNDALNSGNTITPLLSNSSVNLIVQVNVPTAGNSVQNTINVNGTNSVTVTTPTRPAPGSFQDLVVNKSHLGNFTQGQTGATYTLNIRNVGNANTSGLVTITDTLPTGLTYNSATVPSGWNACTVSGQVVTCTTSSVLVPFDASAPSGTTYQITLRVDVASNAPSSVINTVSIIGGGDTTLYTSTDPTDIDPLPPVTNPDLKITKTGSSTLIQGQITTYNLVVQNVGTKTKANGNVVYVKDTVPSDLSLISASGNGWTCNSSGQTVLCSRSDALDINDFYPDIDVIVRASNTFTGSVTNRSHVSGSDTAQDSPTAVIEETNISNNISNLSITINGLPDLILAKTASANFVQGGIGTYTLTVTNIGSAPTTGAVTVIDTLPTGITASLTNFNASNNWTCNSSGQVVTCTNPAPNLVATNGTSAFTFPISIAANPPTSVTNQAIVSGGGETNSGNNTAFLITPITLLPDLQISKSHIGNFIRGATGTYKISVINIGTGATDGSEIKISDTLLTGLTPIAASGSGWSCSISGQNVTCTRNDILAGNGSAYPDIDLTVSVANNAPSSIDNTATVSGTTLGNPAGGESTFGANNTAVDPTLISYIDLSISKTSSDTFSQGSIGKTYKLTVSNVIANPPDILISGDAIPNGTTVTVTDTLPIDLKATAASGLNWSCNISSATFGNTVTCTNSSGVAIGGSYPVITLTVDVASNARAEIANIAQVSILGDANATNNFAIAPTFIDQNLDLAIAKSAPATLSRGQNGAVYSLTVTNKASSNPTNGVLIRVVDTLPAGLTAVDPELPNDRSFTINAWDCSIDATDKIITCTRSDNLEAGSSYPPIQITVNVSSTATSVTNIAVVSNDGGTELPATIADNTASVTTNVIAVNPKLLLVKRITAINNVPIAGFVDGSDTADSNDNDLKWPNSPNSAQYLRGAINVNAKPSDVVEYTIYFLSSGDTAAQNVQICDRIPVNTTFQPNSYGSGSGILLGWDSTGAVLPNPADSAIGLGKVAFTNVIDGDLGQFLETGISATNAPIPCSSGGTNPNGAILVKLGASTQIPAATASGEPKNSYGFVRFAVKIQ